MSSCEGEQTTTVVMPTLVIMGRKGFPSEDVFFTRKLLQQQPFPLRQADGQGRRDGRSQRRRVVMLCQSVQKGFRFHAGSFSVRLSGDEDVSDLKLKTRRLTRALICARCPPVPDLSAARSRSVNNLH